MRVESLAEIEANVNTLIDAIHSNSQDRAAYIELVKNGVDFYPYQFGNLLTFAPSRFIGYKNNSIQQHRNLIATGIAHGTYTSKRIDSIMGSCKEDIDLDVALANYCQSLGVQVKANKHKFWTNDRNFESLISQSSAINDIVLNEIDNDDPKYREIMARVVIRDDKVRKRVFERAKGRCEYGAVQAPDEQCRTFIKRKNNESYLEAHHVLRLADGGKDDDTNVIALCANHHREAHSGIGWEALNEKFHAIIDEKLRK